MNDISGYELQHPNQLLTPCLLVYPERIRANLAAAIAIVGSVDRLRPHVKTHKTPQIVQLALEAGIRKHKCATLAEARMLAECGADDVLLAYPPIGPAVSRLARLVAEFPATRFSTVVDNAAAVTALETEFKQTHAPLDIFLDLDTGMHRTGIAPGADARRLYEKVHASDSLRAAGLHVYDGQNHQPDLAERRTAVAELMRPVWQLVDELRQTQIPVPTLVCGGTPTFPVFAEMESPHADTAIECSPGTCVLSDFNYGRDYPEMEGIAPAAVLMTRIISRPHPGRVTVDLGYKAVASDQPAGRRCHFLNLPEAREVQHSEEHLVLASPQADSCEVGDVLYALPAHVCPTVALHSHVHAVIEGEIVDSWQVQARDRWY